MKVQQAESRDVMRYKKAKVERVWGGGESTVGSVRCHRDKEVRTEREPACATFRK